MGRQIQFYMLPQDRCAFLRFLQVRDPVVVTPMSADRARVDPAGALDPQAISFLCLWNRRILDTLDRKFIPESDDGPYYRIDMETLPVLEFTTPFQTVWDGRPAIGQGRVYGVFENKPVEFRRWYDAVVRWIRANYLRSPARMGGYLGPVAYEFYQKGAYLLPGFSPPTTDQWLEEIRKQHQRE